MPRRTNCCRFGDVIAPWCAPRSTLCGVQADSHGASRYARYAARLAWTPAQPFIAIVSGLTGSGKSTLARELSARTGVPTINSDVVRKELAGKQGRQPAPYNQGIYSAGMTEKTYAKMAREAEKLILSGRGVILDGTFMKRSQRQKILGLAQKQQIPLLAIHCLVSDDITQERLAQRAARRDGCVGWPLGNL